MNDFMARHRKRLEASSYAALHRWSIEAPAEFWAALWDFCEVRCSASYTSVIDHADRMPGARWFTGAELNYADNLLRPEYSGTALVFVNERGDREETSWDELRAQVASVAQALRSMGVEPGDRVAALLPNRPETVVAALATATVGAVWSSCSPDFGVQGVLDRFGQIAPKVLFAVDGYYYAGKPIDTLPTAAALGRKLSSIEAIVMVSYVGETAGQDAVAGAIPFRALLEHAAEARMEQLPFAHPLAILYSSGTTGVPKCIVHSAGGTLLQHLKEHRLHTDIGPDDVVFYFTTCGWMMWNWLLSTLASGATVVLYDGAPLYPNPGELWRMAEREGVTVFGTSAKYLSALESSGFEPSKHLTLGDLQAILSTGSPLAPSSFDFVYAAVKADVQLASISGGTDIVSCFALGNPMQPVYRGELQCRGLGMDVHIFDESGRSVRGVKGELVCASPFPSMPIGFWNDPGGRRYHHAYFDRFPNVWCHGDYAELTEHDGIVMHGRSDAVLNAGGVRIGTSELYRIVEQLPEVLECIAIGQEWQDDTRIVLFVRPQDGLELDDALRDKIRRALREQASPRHVPAKIVAVSDVPRTRSGKIVELAVRDVVHGRGVENLEALANPEALEQYRDHPDLAE